MASQISPLTHQSAPKRTGTFNPISAINTSRPNGSHFKQPKYSLLKNRGRGSQKLLLSIGFIILVTVLATLLYNTIVFHGEGSPSDRVRSALSGDEMKDYTSPENGFTIKMPGHPTISKTTNSTNGPEVPITTYQRVIDNKTKSYTLAVYDYTGLPLDNKKALENALNNSLQNTSGAKIISTNTGSYDGLNAIEATYSVTDADKVYEGHIRFVIKESKMYAMILIGGNGETFNLFANSLRFI